MQEEFEKTVQERVHKFGMPPSPQVWDEVDAVLSKKKHRRVFIGWWILLGLVIAGGGVFLYEKDSLLTDRVNQQPAITRDTTQNNLASAPATIPAPVQKETLDNSIVKNNTSTQTSPQTPNNTAVNTASNTAQVNTTARASRQPITKTGIKGFEKTIPVITGTKKNLTTPQQGQPVTGDQFAANNQPAISKNPVIAPTNKDKEPTVLLPGSTQPAAMQATPAVVGQPKSPIATAANQQPQPPAKVNIKNMAAARGQWYFTLSGGVTNTNTHGFFKNGADKSYGVLGAPFYSDNILALTSPAALKYDVALPGTGFNIAAGAVYQYKLSRRWQVYGGLVAAYVTNTQKTGLLYNQAFSLTTGVAVNYQNFSTQGSYYQGGAGLSKVINTSWQVQVPVGVNYVINPGSKTKLLVNGGLMVGKMLTSHWLIPDERYGRLYYNKNVLNTTILSWQAGPAIELKNNIRFGINYQQSFTTLAKKYVTPQLHWENINFYTAIPFSIKTKKAKH